MASRLEIKSGARILVIDLAFIGDLIMSTPAFTNLRSEFPDATIDLLVAPASRPIIEDNSFFNEIITAQFKRSGFVKLRREASRIRERNYDTAISFHRAHGSLLMLMLAGIPKRIGFSHGGRGLFLTSGIPFQLEKHRAWNHLNLLDKCLAIDVDFKTPTSLEVSTGAVESAREKLANHHPSGPWAAINPNASWPTKKWTAEGFAAVGDFLSDHGYQIALVGGPGDKQDCGKVKSLMKSESLDLSGETTLPELAGLLSLCDLLVTNDSGPMHIGQAIGTKVISIFGPTDPERCGPWMCEIEPVQMDIDCAKCYLKRCFHQTCMNDLSKNIVINRITKCIGFD